jgi:zinc protease
MPRMLPYRVPLCLVGLLLVGGCAQVPTTTPAPVVAASLPPARADAPSGPTGPVRQTLPNGLRLIAQDHRAANIVAIYLWVGVGVRFEKPDQLGYAHFMEHMLFKGTDKWGPGYLDRTVEGAGGRSNAVTSFDYTTFYLIMPTDAMELGMGILSDMAFRSVFDPAEIARERDVIFEEARIEQDNPKSAIVRQLYGLVFDANPYGRPVLGTPATMNAATQERLLAFYKHYYTPENMTLVVVGPVDVKTVRETADRTFGGARKEPFTTVPAQAPPSLTGTQSRTVERSEQQAMLAMGWQAPRSDDPNGDAVDLLTTILAGTESSRLPKRLRDDEQLVSSVSMSYSALMGGGIASLRADLEAKDVEKVQAIILEEIAKMQESGPTEEERQLALIKFEAQHAFDTETSEGLAYAYGLAEMTWTLEAELTYVERLRKVSRAQIQEAARRYLSRVDYARLAFVPKKGQ